MTTTFLKNMCAVMISLANAQLPADAGGPQGRHDTEVQTIEIVDERMKSERLVDLYRRNKQYDKCLAAIRAGHDRGVFYFLLPYRDELSEVEGFGESLEQNERLRQAGIAAAVSTIEVVGPQGFNQGTEYPLLVVFHGGNSTAKKAQQHWHSERLGNEFSVAFVQSYLHYGMTTFGWAQADSRARRDIRRLFEDTLAKYPIDLRRVIVGGVSAEGETVIDAVINGVLPAAGFIGVCPGKPVQLDQKSIAEARDRGVRGFIVSGENDFYLDEQKQMAAMFEEIDLPFRFHVVAGAGHDYPEEFPDWIDLSLEFLLQHQVKSTAGAGEEVGGERCDKTDI